MGLSSKTIQVKIKSSCDVFLELWKTNPCQVPTLTPTTIQNCQIREGEVGTIGSILFWDYFHDTDGSNNLVTWTVEYEKLNPNVPDPDTLLEFYKEVTKDIETQQLRN
ncbi:unnamed protein product [Lactuca saligna]|uniref:Bet v I/Major latex protein domain-containing protein n=1 Tax=Lactuca saligna TaxID=75948 RepID=A0AA36DZ51_LACSI|nr:unnamed protein product [Lactuca saligna]